MPQSLQELQSRFGHTPALTFDNDTGLIRGCLATARAQLEFFVHGAHLARFTPMGQKPWLFMSQEARFAADEPIRGGVPIVFPWFGNGVDGKSSPAHGFARITPWELTGVTIGEESMLSFELVSSDRTRLEWGHDFRARYYVYFGDALTLSLEIENTDERAWSFEAALHTYLSVSDVRQATVEGLDGVSYLDSLTGQMQTQRGDVTFQGETDRIYQQAPESLLLHDPGANRKLQISSNGLSTIVWNPWVDKSRRMDDFGNDEWPEMLCIESGAVRSDQGYLRPGEAATLTATYQIAG
jgi:glucose-6-phosphate 1-epimerase